MGIKLTEKRVITNSLGVHTRPATLIVKLLEESKSAVSLMYNNRRSDAKSVLGILALAIPQNALVTVTVEGEDAQETMARLTELFEEQFGE